MHHSFKVLLKRSRRTWAAIILFNDITIKIVSLVHSFVRKHFYSRYICHPRSNIIENLVLCMQHPALSELDGGVQAETVVCDIFVSMLWLISWIGNRCVTTWMNTCQRDGPVFHPLAPVTVTLLSLLTCARPDVFVSSPPPILEAVGVNLYSWGFFCCKIIHNFLLKHFLGKLTGNFRIDNWQDGAH